MPKETQQTSKLTQQPFNFHKKEKLRAYVTVRSKHTCISGNRRETRIYTRLRVKKSRTGRKVHKIKENRQAETNFTPIKHYQAYMPPDPTQKQRNKSNSKSLNVDKNPQRTTTRNSPTESPILLRREIPMAWGTTIDNLTPKINPFQYAREIKYLTLKDQNSYLILDGWSRSPLSFPTLAWIDKLLPQHSINKTSMLYIIVLC